MVPFFSSKTTGPGGEHASFLDNMSGSGSQYISKQEQAPLFAPQKDMRFANGTPNQTDFMAITCHTFTTYGKCKDLGMNNVLDQD